MLASVDSLRGDKTSEFSFDNNKPKYNQLQSKQHFIAGNTNIILSYSAVNQRILRLYVQETRQLPLCL